MLQRVTAKRKPGHTVSDCINFAQLYFVKHSRHPSRQKTDIIQTLRPATGTRQEQEQEQE